jgi:hypothetical protein
MNNLAWVAGINLKRFIEISGRQPTLLHYAVLLWLKAQEEGKTLDEVVHQLILASTFEKSKVDVKARLKELGY